MWMVAPLIMCDKHLLGEPKEECAMVDDKHII
jgi:hypothetical protein